MNRLFDIATELGEIARKKFEKRFSLANLDRLITMRKRQLIPVGGWPGSNDTQRKAAEIQTLGTDEQLAEWEAAKMSDQTMMEDLDLQREILIAERDAWQWTIRDRETQYDSHRPFDMSVFQAKAMYDEQVKSEAAYAEYMEEQEGYAQDLQRGTIDEVGSPKNDADDEIPF